MVCGVRSEEGVQKTSSLYINKETKYSFKNTTNKEIKALTQYKDNLKTIIFSLGDRKLNPVTTMIQEINSTRKIETSWLMTLQPVYLKS